MEEAGIFREALYDQEPEEEGPRAQADEEAEKASVDEELLKDVKKAGMCRLFCIPVIVYFNNNIYHFFGIPI